MNRREINLELLAAAEMAAHALPGAEHGPVPIDWLALAHSGQVRAAEAETGPPLTVALRDARGLKSAGLDKIAATIADDLWPRGIELVNERGQYVGRRDGTEARGRRPQPTLAILAEPTSGQPDGLALGLPSFEPGLPRFVRASAWTTSLASELALGSWQALGDPKAALELVGRPDGLGHVARAELVVALQCAVGPHVARTCWTGELAGLWKSLYGDGIVRVVKSLLPHLEPGTTRFMPWDERPVTDAVVGACCLVVEATRFGGAKARLTWTVEAALAAVEVMGVLAAYAADPPTSDALRGLTGDLDSALSVRERVASGEDRERLRAAREELMASAPVAPGRNVSVLGAGELIDFTLAATWNDPVRIARDPESGDVLACGVDRFVGAYLKAWAAGLTSKTTVRPEVGFQ